MSFLGHLFLQAGEHNSSGNCYRGAIMPNVEDPWETLARYAALQENLERHDPTAYLDFFSSIQQRETEDPRWKDRAWAVRKITRMLLAGMKKKGIGAYPEKAYRSRIERMVAEVAHPFMVALVLSQILDATTTVAQPLAMMDSILAIAAADRAATAN
jgi:hypothetical protein